MSAMSVEHWIRLPFGSQGKVQSDQTGVLSWIMPSNIEYKLSDFFQHFFGLNDVLRLTALSLHHCPHRKLKAYSKQHRQSYTAQHNLCSLLLRKAMDLALSHGSEFAHQVNIANLVIVNAVCTMSFSQNLVEKCSFTILYHDSRSRNQTDKAMIHCSLLTFSSGPGIWRSPKPTEIGKRGGLVTGVQPYLSHDDLAHRFMRNWHLDSCGQSLTVFSQSSRGEIIAYAEDTTLTMSFWIIAS